jgi:iron complex transport system substrate-binding protein
LIGGSWGAVACRINRERSPIQSLTRVALLVGFGFFASSASVSGQALPAGQATVTIEDDFGRDITLQPPVRRSIVFNAYTLELIRAVAGMDVVVGVDALVGHDHAYWPTVTPEMIVGQGQMAANYEAIVALHPDVVFFPRNSVWQQAAAALKPFGIPVVVLTAWDPDRNDFNVDMLGRIYRQPERAARLIAYCQDLRALLEDRLRGVQPKTVYLEEERSYTTVLKGSGWNSMIENADAVNIFHDVNVHDQPKARGDNQVFEIDPEDVLTRKPDLIVKLDQRGIFETQPRTYAASTLRSMAARPGFDQLESVRNDKVYLLDGRLTHGCSKLIGSFQLAKWLYPDRFRDIDPSRQANDWMRRFQGVPPAQDQYWVPLAAVR